MRADLAPYFRARLSPDERAEILSAEPRTASLTGRYDAGRGYVVSIARAIPGRVLTGTHPRSPIEAFRAALADVEIVRLLDA